MNLYAILFVPIYDIFIKISNMFNMFAYFSKEGVYFFLRFKFSIFEIHNIQVKNMFVMW